MHSERFHENGHDAPGESGSRVPQNHTYEIRCLHVDYERPPREEDVDQERHWRCPARFTFDPYADPPYEQLYCAHHRSLYVPRDPATASEAQRAAMAYGRYERHVTQTIPHGRVVSDDAELPIGAHP